MVDNVECIRLRFVLSTQLGIYRRCVFSLSLRVFLLLWLCERRFFRRFHDMPRVFIQFLGITESEESEKKITTHSMLIGYLNLLVPVLIWFPNASLTQNVNLSISFGCHCARHKTRPSAYLANCALFDENLYYCSFVDRATAKATLFFRRNNHQHCHRKL